MKTKIKKPVSVESPKLLFFVVFLFVILSFAGKQLAAGEVVFRDTFEKVSGEDPNANISNRQQGMTNSTYTIKTHPPKAENPKGLRTFVSAFLEKNSSAFGPGQGSLVMRIAPQFDKYYKVGCDLDRDFAPLVAGRRWSVRYRTQLTSSFTQTDLWFALSLASVGKEEGLGGPDTNMESVAVLIRDTGVFQSFAGSDTSSGSIPGMHKGSVCTVEWKIDETGSRPTLSVWVGLEGAQPVQVLQPFPFILDGAKRHISFQSYIHVSEPQNAEISDGVFEARIGEIVIEREK